VRSLLPFRIFVVQLLFTVVAAAAAVALVRQAFERYAEAWRQEIAAIPVQLPLQPLVNEVAAAYLTRLEDAVPERREAARERISEGLASLLMAVPAISSLVVVDTDLRIQFASDKDLLDLAYKDPEYRALLSSDVESRRPVASREGDLSEVFWPIFAREKGGGGPGERRRLGGVLARYHATATRLENYPTQVPVVPVSWEAVTRALTPFLVSAVMASVLVSAWTVIPVRRLVRAVEEYKARGFRGEIDPESLGLQGDLASAARAISEMAGRLDRLDARGREREALLETLTQSLEEGMVALGPDGVPVAWNAAAARVLVPSGSRDPDGLREAIRLRLAEIGRGEAVSAAAPVEVDLGNGVGGATRCRITSMPLGEKPGQGGMLVLLRDLTMLRKVEAHLVEAGRFATLAHLAGALAHEIRNPLNSIGLNAAAVKENLGSGPGEPRVKAMRECVGTIQEETRRLTDLLNNYLGLLRSSPVEDAVDLAGVCRRVGQLLRYTALKAQVDIVIETDDRLPTVRGVPDRLQQAVLNLALNAIQATPRGGRVKLSARGEGGRVLLTVSDTGRGVPPELIPGLFEAKVTTKPGGTGLGLPLVRIIAEAHGGQVSYAPTPEGGAAFTLVLPLREAADIA
jgi:two-component system, sporulation sensor kinase E